MQFSGSNFFGLTNTIAHTLLNWTTKKMDYTLGGHIGLLEIKFQI